MVFRGVYLGFLYRGLQGNDKVVFLSSILPSTLKVDILFSTETLLPIDSQYGFITCNTAIWNFTLRQNSDILLPAVFICVHAEVCGYSSRFVFDGDRSIVALLIS
jgi:hypothetical protein